MAKFFIELSNVNKRCRKTLILIKFAYQDTSSNKSQFKLIHKVIKKALKNCTFPIFYKIHN